MLGEITYTNITRRAFFLRGFTVRLSSEYEYFTKLMSFLRNFGEKAEFCHVSAGY